MGRLAGILEHLWTDEYRSREEQRLLTYQDVWGSGGTPDTVNAGSIDAGLRLVPVYAATSLIADLVSTASLKVMRELPDGSCVPNPRQPMLVTDPSPLARFTIVDWLHQAMASLLLRGNAYGYELAFDNAGAPSKIIWFHPDEVQVVEEQQDWLHTPTYYWRGRLLDPQFTVHVPAYTIPGSVVGYSPLALFKLQIEKGIKADQFGADWFSNGAAPSGQLKNSQRTVTPEEAQVVKSRFRGAVSSRQPFVTGADWDWSQISVKADEAQFLETIKATATQVAAIYRVSPEDVGGETASSLTYKTLEQDNTKLTGRTLHAWCSRLEAHLSQMLPNKQYVKFDRAELAKGDLTSQMIAHTAALEAGIETLDEARAMYDRAPLTPEQVAEWQANYRSSSPVLTGVPNTKTPAPRPGPSGGANA